MKKGLVVLLMLIMLVTGSMTAYAATVASDYTTMQYAKVNDAGGNTVKISGKGVMGTTVKQGTSFASAVIYKNPVDAKNVNFDLEFIKDYGNGEGRQSGWYAFNISKTPAWFSSTKSVIKAEGISGVNVIFKLDTANKKKAYMEISRYSPGTGFTYIFGSTIEAELNEEWKCHVDITKGVLYVDGKEILDLSDALTVSLGTANTGYLGFGGFSENNHDIEMNVKFAGSDKVVDAPSIEKPDAGNTNTGNTNTGNTNTEKPDTGNTNTGNTNTGSTNTEKPNTGNTDTAKPDASIEQPGTENEEPKTDIEGSETDNGESGNDNESVNSDTPSDEKPVAAQTDTIIIVLAIILALAILACGGIGFAIVKGKKAGRKEK